MATSDKKAVTEEPTDSTSNPLLTTRLLNVEIVEGKKLLALNKSGTSDAYAVVSLLDLAGRIVKGETYTTTTKNGTIHPVWGNVYDLDVDSESLPSIQIEVFHKGQYSVSEEPLGVVTIQLDSITIPIQTDNPPYIELWPHLEVTGRMKEISGKIGVRLAFNRISYAADIEKAINPFENENFDEVAEEPPNELDIKVLQARGLLAVDKPVFGQSTSNPLVRLKLLGHDTLRTKYLSKTLYPVWNTSRTFKHVTDPTLSLEVVVDSRNNISTNTFIGKAIIPLKDFDDKKPVKKWYTLKNKVGEVDKEKRGEIELQIHWRFSASTKAAAIKKQKELEQSMMYQISKTFTDIGRTIGALENSDEEAENDDDHEKMQELVRPTEEEEKAKKKTDQAKTPEEKEAEQKKQAEETEKKKKEAEKRKELEEIQIKSGDYQIQVHVIEARDLNPENMDGTSDPVVFVECFGQKRNTVVISSVTSCVYDELFIFNMKDLSKESFEEGFIRISCYDSDPLLGNENALIGAYATDAMMIYTMNKDHELYRQWIPLMDDTDPEAVGVQGYLKITIQIVGPGEKIKVHDEEAELAAELAREAAAGADIGSLVLSTPTIQKEWKYLVCKVYKCEGLPVMDEDIGVGAAKFSIAGTDAFCKMTMGGGKEIVTKVVETHGQSRFMMNPAFNTELWYPVSVPTTAQVIKFTIWDADFASSELIGICTERYNVINKAPLQDLGLRWYNMYGAPEFKGDGPNIGGALQSIGAAIDWKVYYNNNPEKGSSFKGRALLGFRVEDSLPPKQQKAFKGEVKPFRLRIKQLKTSHEPKTFDYRLQAIVIVGNGLPQFGTLSNESLRIKICMGIHEIGTKAARYEPSGLCRWNEFLISERLPFPQDVTQLPDIFIYLVREDDKPVCFLRIKPVQDAKTKQLLGFSQSATWYYLQEDKVINGLSDNTFAGTVLIKLGFGLAEDAERSVNQWSEIATKILTAVPHQVRVHLFQGKNLPAADSNGLSDPYVKVNFLGQKELTSDYKEKTLFPMYYETLIFDNVHVADIDDYEYAPQIHFTVFDDNLSGPKYLGTTFFNLRNAIQDPDPMIPVYDLLQKFPDSDSKHNPFWLPLFREQPGDGEGEILVAVQLIPTFGKLIPQPIDKHFTIPTRSAFVEFLVIGCRDLAPYNFQPVQLPFLDIELASFNTVYKSETQPSKKPDPSNPNYLTSILMPVELPEKSIFAAPLQVKVKDTRLGGYLKPLIGVCQVPLDEKLPWDESTYVPPQTQNFAAPEDDSDLLGGVDKDGNKIKDAIAKQAEHFQAQRSEELKGDDFAGSPEPLPVDQLIKQRMAADDSGAGIFGALHHIKADGTSKKKANAEDAFVDPDWTQDDGDQPPPWSVGRKKLESELEVELKTTPFETYDLKRGANNAFLGTKIKTVGKLKCIVRVIRENNEPPILPQEVMDNLFNPKTYQIRLYCLKAVKLEAMDYDIFGNKTSSDPYLKVTLGKNVFNDRENAVEDQTDVDLYKLVTLETELPGVSQLNIDIMDQDMIGSDEVIGSTSIDLEDRIFDGRWRDWGKENKIMPGTDEVDPTKVRFATKPIERRSLYVPGFSIGRGVLECWVDILTTVESSAFPPDDVSLPPTAIFEVRVVIWKTKNVPPMDTFEGMSDLFVKCWPEGCAPQETDTHWRCKKGKASFNWRMLFDVELGNNTRAMKFPYLHLQLWDRDILKWNDCAGEGLIDLKKFYRKAYKRNIAIKLFEKKQGITAKRAKQREKATKYGPIEIEDTQDDIPPDEDFTELEKKELAKRQKKGWLSGAKKEKKEKKKEPAPIPPPAPGTVPPNGNYVNPVVLLPPRDTADSDDDDDSDEEDDYPGYTPPSGALDATRPRKSKKSQSRGSRLLKKKPDKKKKKKVEETPPSSGWFGWFGGQKKAAEEEKKDGEGGEDTDALLKKEGEGEEEVPEKTEEEKKEDEDDELKALITSFKNMTGLWDIDPDDSCWYHLETRDKNDPSKVTPMGSICYSIQIWPKDKAVVMAVGAARSDPNTNPFLPPPTGRMTFSFNPFVMGSELCGPVLCAKIFMCFLCMAFIVLMIFFQPFLNIIINLIFVVY